jgi:hypothetical protein
VEIYTNIDIDDLHNYAGSIFDSAFAEMIEEIQERDKSDFDSVDDSQFDAD